MDIQKTMEFLLDQQAAHAVRIAEIDELLKSAVEMSKENEHRFRVLAAIAESHESELQQHDSSLTTHKEWVTAISQELQVVSRLMQQAMEAGARTDLKLDRLADSQARTDLKFDQLADSEARIDQALERLAIAQSVTEEKLQRLIEENRRPPSVQ